MRWRFPACSPCPTKEFNLDGRSPHSLRFPHLEAGGQLGIARFMKPSNMGTVKAVSPVQGSISCPS